MRQHEKSALFVFTLFSAVAAFAADPDGAAVYEQRCALCHDASTQTRAPAPSALRMMSQENVLRALETGLMREQGAALSAAEKGAVAAFLVGKVVPARRSAKGCADASARFTIGGVNWNGWGAGPENARFQTAAGAGLTAEQVPKLKLKWSFAYPDTFVANGQPSVVGGRVFVASANRNVYSLNMRTGCQYWSFESEAPVRTAITVAEINGRPTAMFADRRGSVYALDAANGELRWKIRAADHPRGGITGAPVFAFQRLFVPITSGEEGAANDPTYECCTARGAIAALDTAGKKIWQSYAIPQEPKIVGRNEIGTPVWGPSGASIWSAPTIDLERGAVYASTGDNFTHPDSKTSDAILAFDIQDGKMLWSRQLLEGDVFSTACVTTTKRGCPENAGPDFDFGSSPILVRLANGKRLLVTGQKSGMVHAIDPDRKGAIVWQTRAAQGGILGGVQWGPASDGKIIYVAVSDLAFIQFSLERGKPRIVDPKSGGGMVALEAATGKKVWATAAPLVCGDRPNCSPAQSAAVSGMPGVVFSGSLDGHFRAYSTRNGKIIWDFDSARDFDAVNGPGKGGSIDGPGAAIAGGMVFVNSGYGNWGGRPGNMLLAFSVDGK